MRHIRGKVVAVCLFMAVLFFFIHLVAAPDNVEGVLEDDSIAKWAEKFGNELWELGKFMTKSPEIKSKYKEYNARVERKEGNELLASIIKSMKRLLASKVHAVECIRRAATKASEEFEYNETEYENFQYYSSKYSQVEGMDERDHFKYSDNINNDTYLRMFLEEDTHFYNICVNTNHSSVHVPSNVYDGSEEVWQTIIWSEKLDSVFTQNYNTDPALSWQYFGSDTGILRHYPALIMEPEKEHADEQVDMYDCRKRSWYIETATCSKDIVILCDFSGSMYGYKTSIAKLTISSILNTFSNNDFFTVFRYSEELMPIMPCFNDTLVQATPENINVFNDELARDKPTPSGNAKPELALEKAFDILAEYRNIRECSYSSAGCNQAIMIITDDLNEDLTRIFEKYNREMDDHNSTKIPVRIFTYLLWKEISKEEEIQKYACSNRGYYSHIRNLEQVSEEVLKYVDVIALPLVLQQEEYPPTWTHVFADRSYRGEAVDKENPSRLMIAVGVPAFDPKAFSKDYEKKTGLLGVAGTDIPIEDINKLALPYKLGVNGYSFVVSNNGYVILHPALKPNEGDYVKKNLNSIDFSEVEQLHDGSTGRKPGEQLIKLRHDIVSHSTGQLLNVTVKYHYDGMRRVSPERQDYFYAPLDPTPFSFGLVLPTDYGKTWIKVGDEIARNKHNKINISNYFIGENWKVHPKWVYCKYHYLEGHEFQNPEEELKLFLVKVQEKDWKWSQQYETDIDLNNIDCENKTTLGPDSYYCNRELVELLVFDAKVTNTSYGTWKFTNPEERNLIELYNATLRFVATMSGLTRWQFIFGEVEVDTDREFGDYHKYAIDETWYKNAVLQHAIDPESFVYFVPHEGDEREDEELKVTASHAIFPRDGGLEAPGCVVGFKFSHALMVERFANITSEANCPHCGAPCSSEESDCYVIDNNGYIVISEIANQTGRFFGEVNGAVMLEMVDQQIFQNITVYDLQGACLRMKVIKNLGSFPIDPVKALLSTLKWALARLLFYWAKLSYWVEGTPFYGSDPSFYDEIVTVTTTTDKPQEKSEGESFFDRKPEYDSERYPCDFESNLYYLRQDKFIKGQDYNDVVPTICSHPFHVKRIPKSNLILVVVKAVYTSCIRFLTASKEIIDWDAQFPCHKLYLNDFYRRRLEECYTEHSKEEEFAYCGRSNILRIDFMVFLPSILAAMLYTLQIRI